MLAAIYFRLIIILRNRKFSIFHSPYTVQQYLLFQQSILLMNIVIEFKTTNRIRRVTLCARIDQELLRSRFHYTGETS